MTADLVPLPPAVIEQAPDTLAAEMVTAALVESRAWLTKAMEVTDPTPIAEFKAWAATVEEATKQKKLGREIELDAAEMVRRAERGIGVAIRNGQEAGEIKTRGDGGPQGDYIRGEAVVRVTHPVPVVNKRSASEFFNGGQDMTDTYAITDDVTDEQFDAAITEAKAEGNLSRTNVVRKIKGEKPKPTGRPEILRKTRRIDSNRIIEATVNTANPDAGGVLAEVDFTALDHARLETWISSLSSHIRGLRSLRSQLEKELNRRVSA